MLAQPQVAALGSVQELQHAAAGPYRLLGPPLRVDQAALAYPRPAPVLGADTRAVLSEAGLTGEEIDSLLAGGAAVAP